MLYQGIMWAFTVGIILILAMLITSGIAILDGIRRIFSDIDNITDEIGVAIRDKIGNTKSVVRMIDMFDTMLRHAMCTYISDNPFEALFHPFHSYHVVAMDTAILFKVENPDLFT